jgi:hypothetical protein
MTRWPCGHGHPVPFLVGKSRGLYIIHPPPSHSHMLTLISTSRGNLTGINQLACQWTRDISQPSRENLKCIAWNSGIRVPFLLWYPSVLKWALICYSHSCYYKGRQLNHNAYMCGGVTVEKIQRTVSASWSNLTWNPLDCSVPWANSYSLLLNPIWIRVSIVHIGPSTFKIPRTPCNASKNSTLSSKGSHFLTTSATS